MTPEASILNPQPGHLTNQVTRYGGDLDFVAEVRAQDGLLLVSSGSAAEIYHLVKEDAERLVLSGEEFEQSIAVPETGTFQLRASIVDPDSKRAGSVNVTLDQDTSTVQASTD